MKQFAMAVLTALVLMVTLWLVPVVDAREIQCDPPVYSARLAC